MCVLIYACKDSANGMRNAAFSATFCEFASQNAAKSLLTGYFGHFRRGQFCQSVPFALKITIVQLKSCNYVENQT